jgi:hypothetical protein
MNVVGICRRSIFDDDDEYCYFHYEHKQQEDHLRISRL